MSNNSNALAIVPFNATNNASSKKQRKRNKKKNSSQKQVQLVTVPKKKVALQKDKGIPIVKVTRPFRTGKARITSNGDTTLVCHTELLGTVSAAANQSVWQILLGMGLGGSGVFRLNAGSETTNPFLATFARNFEFYRYRKLIFHYVSRCPTTQGGSVMLTPEYDAEDSNPTTEQGAAMNVDSVENAPYNSFLMRSDPLKMNAMYKRHVTMSDTRFPTTTQDEKTVDVGKVILSGDIQNVGGTSFPLGKLWVEYECELFAPQNPGLTVASTAQSTLTTMIPNSLTPITPAMSNSLLITGQNPRNPLLLQTPQSTNTNIVGTLARNAPLFIDLFLNGTNLPLGGGSPTFSLLQPNGVTSSPITPFQQAYDTVNSNAMYRYFLPWAATSATTIPNAGAQILLNSVGTLGTTIAAARMILTNMDQVAFGLAPVGDL